MKAMIELNEEDVPETNRLILNRYPKRLDESTVTTVDDQASKPAVSCNNIVNMIRDQA
jgi:hypothetical protein